MADAPAEKRFWLLTKVSDAYTAIVTEYHADERFRWVMKTGPVFAFLLALIFGICTWRIGCQWKTAFDILLGDAAPSSIVPTSDYVYAAVIAGMGYVVVPVFIGLVVSTFASVLAVRRVSKEELAALVDRVVR